MNQRVISLSHFGHDLITTGQPQNPNENSSVVATRQFKMLCKTTSNTHHVLTLETGKRLWRRIESKFSSEENFGIHAIEAGMPTVVLPFLRPYFTAKSLTMLLISSVPLNCNNCFISSIICSVSDIESHPVSGYHTPVCGLVFLTSKWRRKVHVICNPATGEFLNLPKVL
ncbi:hypothetical protein F2Q68_00031594 [Brassica cretica]|uniref:Uncharacterized protein n=1 Tax=Brassica cretica TaxID=69181 RepID=A0A8S9G3V9_BRACR|nr:hypothetical protein F2Q68_00031594 [Brassica cretica]